MKKFLLSLSILAGVVGSSAITLDEAYEQIAALPGAALSEMPPHDVLKDGYDWGKIVMLMPANKTTIESVYKILDEVTDEVAVDTVAQGTNPVKGYKNVTEEGKTHALVVCTTKMGVFAVYGQGDDTVVEKLHIN